MRCKHCKILFTPQRFNQKTCSIDCAIKYSKFLTEVKEQKAWKERKEELIEKTKSLSDYMRDLQKEVNAIARLIDRGHPCISSGRYTGQMQGGHFFSVGSCNTLRFNLFNIYGQSSMDNNYKSGNIEGYRKGITSTFGESHLLFMENLKLEYPMIRFDKEELKEVVIKARKIVRELKKRHDEGIVPYSNKERLERRKEINDFLGLY